MTNTPLMRLKWRPVSHRKVKVHHLELEDPATEHKSEDEVPFTCGYLAVQLSSATDGK